LFVEKHLSGKSERDQDLKRKGKTKALYAIIIMRKSGTIQIVDQFIQKGIVVHMQYRSWVEWWVTGKCIIQ